MKTWKIPVTWEVYGVVRIEAETLDDAIKLFDETENDLPLPTENDYVDGSFARDRDEETISLINNL